MDICPTITFNPQQKKSTLALPLIFVLQMTQLPFGQYELKHNTQHHHPQPQPHDWRSELERQVAIRISIYNYI